MPRVVTEPAELLELLRSGCEWAEHVSLCLARCDSAGGGLEAWCVLERQLVKVDVAILNLDAGSAEPLLIRALNARGVLRAAPGTPAVMTANVFLFRRGSEARVLLGSADLTHAGLGRGVSATVYAAGQMTDDFFCGVHRLIERCSGLAHVPTLEDVDAYLQTWKRSSSMLPPRQTAVAAIPIHETLKTIDEPGQVAACVQVLSATIMSAQMDRDIEIIRTDSRWILRLLGGDHARHIDVSIPTPGPDAACDAAFVEGVETKHRYLIYRALFRNRARVAEHLFWASRRYRPVELSLTGNKETTRVAVVCELGTVETAAHLVGFGAELRRVRDRDGEPDQEDADEAYDFLSEDSDVQTELVWSILVGEGALGKDAAIRAAAQALRANGAVSYKRLDSDGQVYTAIGDALDAGIKEGVFDRPRRGHVRAIVADLGADDWRHCLLSTLDEEPTERAEAIRAAAEYATEYYGIKFERLRRGGRIEKAVKSAINSCLRRGLIRDVGKDLIQVVERLDAAVG